MSAGDFKYGLIVDTLLDSSEIVVKPLGYHLCDCREYAGATILGDGQVALILDIVGIRRILEMKDKSEAISDHLSRQPQNSLTQNDHQSFLVVQNGEEEFFAIPLGLIARIEKVKECMVKTTGGKQSMQYRRGSLRLFSIESVANVKPRKKSSDAYVVIFQIAGREAGIVVSGIVDTLELNAATIDSLTHAQSGILGSAQMYDSIALVIDLFGIVKSCAPEFCVSNVEGCTTPATILIVDDSPFFLHQIRSFIEDAGYSTVCAENGVDGLELLMRGDPLIDLVVTDIEMPKMNGLEFTRAIRADENLRELPVIAVTSVSGQKAEQLGREAGIDEYLIKLERNAILNACEKYLKKRVTEPCQEEI